MEPSIRFYRDGRTVVGIISRCGNHPIPVDYLRDNKMEEVTFEEYIVNEVMRS